MTTDKGPAPGGHQRAGSAQTTRRCRRIEVVDADMVIGPCDECRDCGQPGSWDNDHWRICLAPSSIATRLDLAIRRQRLGQLAEADR